MGVVQNGNDTPSISIHLGHPAFLHTYRKGSLFITQSTDNYIFLILTTASAMSLTKELNDIMMRQTHDNAKDRLRRHYEEQRIFHKQTKLRNATNDT